MPRHNHPTGRISEAAFQSTVVELARLYGWKVHHTRPVEIRPGRWATPIQGDAGFPDLVLVHPFRGVIFAELKTDTGRRSKAQEDWATDLVLAGAEYYTLRPQHLPQIQRRLAGQTGNPFLPEHDEETGE